MFCPSCASAVEETQAAGASAEVAFPVATAAKAETAEQGAANTTDAEASRAANGAAGAASGKKKVHKG